MQQNQITNTVGWSLVGAPTLLAIIKWIVGIFGDVQTAAEMFVLVRGLDINWIPIGVFVAAVGIAILGVQNWRWVYGYFSHRRAREERRWHLEIKEALEYIAYGSVLWKSAGPHAALDVAIRAFLEAAQTGKLKAGGRLLGGGLPVAIKPHVWRDYKIHQVATAPTENRNPHIRVFALLRRPDAEEPLFEAIMVDRDEVHSIWPPRTDWRV